ncbi:hypothetical protein DFP72DRAFT_946542 [Ephemerocybe angulata]|uniref:F-box domain-containing protein n=1 Tax=Ephemerocybe angulata TaxID=980116 RepID=A0A8H6H623_9AGAR|nr:hypothetical protein DFP72DRAFT_946542 [Tulosesus angulatus]
MFSLAGAEDLSMAELTLEQRGAPQSPSPISTLPVELLFKVFYFSLRWADARGHSRRNTYPERTRLAINHVSQLWRATALRFPELWDEIYVREKTGNSQGRPLYLSVRGSRAARGLSYILGWEDSVPTRVKGIYLCGRLSEYSLTRISNEDTMYTLEGLTNLREIELRGWTMRSFPWIKSPFLTRLSIEPALIPTKVCMTDLLNLLRTSPQLEYLRIEFGLETHWMFYVEPPVVEDVDRHNASISLPRLTTLRIASTSSLPLCTGEFAAEKVMSALDVACNRLVPPPPSLYIQAPEDDNKSPSFRDGIIFTAVGSAPSGVNNKPLHVEVTIISPKLAGSRYPFDGLCDWLLSALSTAKVSQYPTLAFWRALASTPSLGKVAVWVRKHDVSFVQALRGNGDIIPTNAGEPNPLVHSQSAVRRVSCTPQPSLSVFLGATQDGSDGTSHTLGVLRPLSWRHRGSASWIGWFSKDAFRTWTKRLLGSCILFQRMLNGR